MKIPALKALFGLACCLQVAASAPTAAPEIAPDTTPAVQNAEPPPRPLQIHMSADTSQRLGWVAARLADIAGTDIMVITREDIRALQAARQMPDAAPRAPGIAEPHAVYGIFDRLAPHLSVRLRGHFSLFEVVVMEGAALAASATAYPVDFDGDGENDFGIIVAPDLAAETAEQALGSTHIKTLDPGLMAGVPGAARDYIAIIMMHEACHMRQPVQRLHQEYPSNPLPFEVHADQCADRAAMAAETDGEPLHPEARGIAYQARLTAALGAPINIIDKAVNSTPERGILGIGSMTARRFPSHSTHWALNPEDPVQWDLDHVQQKVEESDTLHAVMAVNTHVSLTMAFSHMLANAVGLPLPRDAEAERLLIGEEIHLLRALLSPIHMNMLGSHYAHKHLLGSLAVADLLRERKVFQTLENRPLMEEFILNARSFFERFVPGFETHETYRNYRRAAEMALKAVPADRPDMPVPFTIPANPAGVRP